MRYKVVVPVTIVDDDFPVWNHTVVPDRVAEGETARVTVGVSNDVVFPAERTVNLTFGGSATAPADYTVGSASLTLGQVARASAATTLTIAEDTLVEGDETIVVTATLDDGTVLGQRAIAIVDDDDTSMPRTVSIMPKTGAERVFEGTDAVFTLRLDAAPEADLTVRVMVSERGEVISRPGDFAAPVSVTFSTADTVKELTVTTDDDTVTEALPDWRGTAGRITAVVQAGAGYVPDPAHASATVAITDDETVGDDQRGAGVHQRGGVFGEREPDGRRNGGRRRLGHHRRGGLLDHRRSGCRAVLDRPGERRAGVPHRPGLRGPRRHGQHRPRERRGEQRVRRGRHGDRRRRRTGDDGRPDDHRHRGGRGRACRRRRPAWA